MAFTEAERVAAERLTATFVAKRRPPLEIRHKVDIGYRITGQSIEIFEIRPYFPAANRTIEEPVAKTTFIRRKGVWRVYWMRRDLKWHAYPVKPEVRRLEQFYQLVDEGSSCCFWG